MRISNVTFKPFIFGSIPKLCKDNVKHLHIINRCSFCAYGRITREAQKGVSNFGDENYFKEEATGSQDLSFVVWKAARGVFPVKSLLRLIVIRPGRFEILLHGPARLRFFKKQNFFFLKLSMMYLRDYTSVRKV